MLEDFQYLDLFPVTIFEIITNLIVALICGLIIESTPKSKSAPQIIEY